MQCEYQKFQFYNHGFLDKKSFLNNQLWSKKGTKKNLLARF
jgi:hypothetical protein